ASALQVVLALPRPADTALRLFFRDHPELGQRDRGFVAELVFAVLRHLRLLEHLTGDPQPRRLALAALSLQLGFSVRELTPNLAGGDDGWLGQARAEDQAQPPPPIRPSLPLWFYERSGQKETGDELETLGRGLLQPAPLDLRVNTMLTKRDEVLAAFERDDIAAAATPYSPVGVRLESKPALQG